MAVVPKKSARLQGTPPRRSVLLAQYWWEDRVLHGVAKYAVEHNWTLDCRMRWIHALPEISDWSGDGIIAYLGVAHRADELVKFVRAAAVPVVETQAPTAHAGGAQVIVSHEAIGAAAAGHFLELNFRHLGFVIFDENPIERLRCESFAKRVRAARREFREISFRELAGGVSALPLPTALMAANDINALEVIRVCRAAGRRVPEEIAVIGVDDSPIVCDLAPVPLTSVNCDYERQGYEAAALLDRMMAGEKKPEAAVTIQPRGVTVRHSSDTIAMPDLEAARALRFLRDHYREPITIEDVARDAGRSLRHIQGAFRLHAGRTMSTELARLRLEHARRLLANPKTKIETVAAESGYASRFHFVRAFKRGMGVSPKAYRTRLASSPVRTTSEMRKPHMAVPHDR